MKSYDYEGYTTENGGIVCCDCVGFLPYESEKELGYFPIFADSEWDYYPVCDICQQELDYVSLTNDGIEYIARL